MAIAEFVLYRTVSEMPNERAHVRCGGAIGTPPTVADVERSRERRAKISTGKSHYGKQNTNNTRRATRLVRAELARPQKRGDPTN